MTRLSYFFLLIFISGLSVVSCRQPRMLLKENIKIDTLRIHLATGTIQQFEYKQAIERKANRFVQVYNTEKHPFYLKLEPEEKRADCNLEFIKAKFVSKQKNKWATVISTAGIITPIILISTQFFLPVGWVYIPNARTTLRAGLSSNITDINEFPSIVISSSGMYRSKEKQIDLQSTKVIKYLIEIVQNIENEHILNTQQQLK